MGLESAIQEAMANLANISIESNEDQMSGELEQKRKDGLERIRTQIYEAQQEIATMKESIRNLEEAQKEKTMTANAIKSQLVATTSELKELREEEIRSLSLKIKKFREREVEARSEFSVKDVAALEETKLKLRVCCALTGVYFNSSEEYVSSGRVANTATRQVKLFDVNHLSRKEATGKIWKAIEKTTARLE